MQIILTDDVANLGRRGDIVSVANGYGRNFLIPKGLALPATEGNRRVVEEQRVALSKKDTQFKEAAEVVAADLSKHHVVISRKSGDTGVLFGSVTTKDIGEVLAGGGYQVDRRKISLEHALKAIGNFHVEVALHSEVKVQLLVSVAPEGDEPVARVLHKGEESDGIFEEIEDRVKLIQSSQESASPEAPPEPDPDPSRSDPA